MWHARRLLLYRAIAGCDALLGVAAFVVAYRMAPYIRGLVEPGVTVALEPFREYAWLAILLAPGWPIALSLQGLQGPLRERPLGQIIGNVLRAGALIAGSLALTLYALKVPYSRVFVFSAATLGTLLVLAEKLSLRVVFAAMHRRGFNRRDVVIIGSKARARDILERLHRLDGLSIRVLGCLETDRALVGKQVLGIPIIGAIDDHRREICDSNADEVLIAMPLDSIPELPAILDFCEQIGVMVRIVPDYQLRRYRSGGSRASVSFDEFYGIPMFTLTMAPIGVWPLVLKRSLDIAVSGVGLLLSAPVFALVAVAIKLTSEGPIFYRWRVSGLNGKAFVGYKFRTMVPDADERKKALLARNEMNGPVFKMGKDPRVTPLGRVLRKYSLDELPQLWSVLKGHMSLVGPRPAFPVELARYEYWHRRKLSVRPGITCLWQVNGRNAVSDFNEWVRMDLEYIDNWSLGLDLKILLKTISTVLRGTGK